MAVIFSIDYTGTVDPDDLLAARHIIFLENQRRAALTPPGTPLLFSTGPQIKASYLATLLATVTSAHLSYVQQAKSAQGTALRFTPSEIETIHANLVARLNAGESAASLVTDTAA